ncbi:MAG: hypothetical protein CMJ49_01130 [Planctomycetaceae bacterium]|nr:hypothetical protein [Planctomycetaceae bacterium]
MRRMIAIGMICGVVGMSGAALGQSSSLLVNGPAKPPVWQQGRLVDRELQEVSYVAVAIPKPRAFEVNDLVEIIIRESSSAKSEATLETEKDVKVKGSLDALPQLRLRDLIDLQLNQNQTASNDIPKVEVSFQNDFGGEGEYERKDTLADRIMARVVDVKPNGTIALEARRWIKVDDEETEVKLTGYCRAEDVTINNNVLSNQLFDLRIEKHHAGELRKTSKKGLLTKILDAVFNF